MDRTVETTKIKRVYQLRNMTQTSKLSMVSWGFKTISHKAEVFHSFFFSPSMLNFLANWLDKE